MASAARALGCYRRGMGQSGPGSALAGMVRESAASGLLGFRDGRACRVQQAPSPSSKGGSRWPVRAGLSHEAGYTAQAAAHPRGGVHGSGHDGAGCHDRERCPSVLAARASPLARGPGMGGECLRSGPGGPDPDGRGAGRSFGRKRVFISGIGLFMLASVGCALSVSGGMLIGCRVIQGIGGAVSRP